MKNKKSKPSDAGESSKKEESDQETGGEESNHWTIHLNKASSLYIKLSIQFLLE